MYTYEEWIKDSNLAATPEDFNGEDWKKVEKRQEEMVEEGINQFFDQYKDNFEFLLKHTKNSQAFLNEVELTLIYVFDLTNEIVDSRTYWFRFDVFEIYDEDHLDDLRTARIEWLQPLPDGSLIIDYQDFTCSSLDKNLESKRLRDCIKAIAIEKFNNEVFLKYTKNQGYRREIGKRIIKRTEYNKSELSQIQTQLLFYYLRMESCLLKDVQRDSIAEAIEILTGFSAKQLRKPIVKEISKQSAHDFEPKIEDFNKISDVLKKILDKINQDKKSYEK